MFVYGFVQYIAAIVGQQGKNAMLLRTTILLSIGIAVLAEEINSYDPDYGTFIGELPNLADGDVRGKVYVVNDTTLQIVNFTYNGNAPG
ncbi:hypothetical protein ANCCEY_00305 [Ancylostoma ceylanicum]|uniref:DM13 domain-containing protein n=1 Tax=Ancylostoma ceylanicum TaxID=53326 RepID=A0A0D6MBR8_9BILA|nr:hypothetical protein ANCCEY_00305 [Ancylostoma ceylanicum]